MSKVKELGMELVENAEKCCLQRTRENNVQVLHAKFKRDVESYVQSYAKTITPKLDKLIQEKGKNLKNVLNNRTADMAEKQMLAGMLDEEIRNL